MKYTISLTLFFAFIMTKQQTMFTELRGKGYHVEFHEVITEDDYILALYRISGYQDQSNIGKTPLLFQHGIMDSSDCWSVNADDKAPALVAVKEGYDVWLSNSRGNKYSRSHLSMNPNKDPFWQYSF